MGAASNSGVALAGEVPEMDLQVGSEVEPRVKGSRLGEMLVKVSR